MTNYILDTDVLIEFFKKRDPGLSLTKELLEKGTVVTSILTVSEILTGWNEEQAQKHMPILKDLFPRVSVNEEIAELGGKLRNRYRREGITLQLPDALIAATALVNGFCLVTFNVRHYPMPQLKLYQLQ